VGTSAGSDTTLRVHTLQVAIAAFEGRHHPSAGIWWWSPRAGVLALRDHVELTRNGAAQPDESDYTLGAALGFGTGWDFEVSQFFALSLALRAEYWWLPEPTFIPADGALDLHSGPVVGLSAGVLLPL
jgi:hypothetical protein